MQTRRQQPNDAGLFHHRLEGDGRILDIAFLDDDPQDETGCAANDRGNDASRLPRVIRAAPDETEDQNTDRRDKDEVAEPEDGKAGQRWQDWTAALRGFETDQSIFLSFSRILSSGPLSCMKKMQTRAQMNEIGTLIQKRRR